MKHLQKCIKQNILFKVLIVYLLVWVSILPIFNCGSQGSLVKEEQNDFDSHLPPEISDPVRDLGTGGEEADPLLVEEPPEGCENMRDCLAREEEEIVDEPIEESLTDENGNIVWDESNSQPLYCIPGNPNKSVLKKLRVKTTFCIDHEDALVIDKDKLYFQHFSDGLWPIKSDLEYNAYLEWFNRHGEEANKIFRGKAFVVMVAAIIAFLVKCLYVLLVIVVGSVIATINELVNGDTCPPDLFVWEPADVGLNLQCGETGYWDEAKIVTNNSIIKESDVWLSPATLPYDLNINIDPNCTTDIRNFSLSKVGDSILVASKVTAANGGNSRKNTILFRILEDLDNSGQSIDLFEFSFDYYYFALE